ncbi:MAG TPA: FAD-dependent thymidylate synthase [Ktedonobacterales bacterium]|nr:FAD-dependent thymidylate synthase [Ktedonobacterales bacterium]
MRIYSVSGAPPEIQAYGLAKYSRSAQSLEQSIDELSAQRAEQFLNTFYFQYGHASIADLAHVTLALENISMLAAFHVVDEPVWDGQERSSRYQNFRDSGFYIPPELAGTPDLAPYQEALEHALGQYERFSTELTNVLKAMIPQPEGMTPATYTRKLRARAFDVARYFLPLATLTSVGQVTSARTLERQISRLAGSSLAELRDISAAMKEACQTPGYNFVERKLDAARQRDGLTPEQIEAQRQALREAGLIAAGAVPTLVKYTAPDTYAPETLAAAKELLQPYFDALGDAPDTQSTLLIPPETDLLDALTMEFLYLADTRGRRYHQLLSMAGAMPAEVKQRLFELTMAKRGPHDDWLRAHRLGYALGFDLLLDFGALRDLHRHRRCVQILPDLNLHLGCDDGQTIFTAALGERGAALAEERGLIADFDRAMRGAINRARTFPRRQLAGYYLLPLGARQRALFKMDLAEAAYMIEQRSAVGGHFAYRRVAYEMYGQLSERHPWLAASIRASNPAEVDDPLAR